MIDTDQQPDPARALDPCGAGRPVAPPTEDPDDTTAQRFTIRQRSRGLASARTIADGVVWHDSAVCVRGCLPDALVQQGTSLAAALISVSGSNIAELVFHDGFNASTEPSPLRRFTIVHIRPWQPDRPVAEGIVWTDQTAMVRTLARPHTEHFDSARDLFDDWAARFAVGHITPRWHDPEPARR